MERTMRPTIIMLADALLDCMRYVEGMWDDDSMDDMYEYRSDLYNCYQQCLKQTWFCRRV